MLGLKISVPEREREGGHHLLSLKALRHLCRTFSVCSLSFLIFSKRSSPYGRL